MHFCLESERKIFYPALETLVSHAEDKSVQSQAKGALWIIHGKDRDAVKSALENLAKPLSKKISFKKKYKDTLEVDDAEEGLSFNFYLVEILLYIYIFVPII